MTDGWKEIGALANKPSLTAAQVATGPVIPPQQQLLLYSDDQWEDFVQEWAHYCLKPDYVKVWRFTGAGDRGIDVAGFVDAAELNGVWDNYQCKHYGKQLAPTDVWVEFGKIIWYSFKGEYKPPRRYYFVAPQGIGTKLSNLLLNAAKLRTQLIQNWDKYVRHEITETAEVPLGGALLDYLNAFDFSIFTAKNALQLVDAHRTTPVHAARFGGGLRPRPDGSEPPELVAVHESIYVSRLLDAYADHKKVAVEDTDSLTAWPPLKAHFQRQREAFYRAESLREFAKDTVPTGTFESLQDDIYDGVVDTCDASHTDGYARVCEVTKTARTLQITANPLISCVNPKDRDGICHQLANDERLQWTE